MKLEIFFRVHPDLFMQTGSIEIKEEKKICKLLFSPLLTKEGLIKKFSNHPDLFIQTGSI